MAEEYTIIMFPEFEKLLNEVRRLRTELSMLLLERDELQYVQCKNIETAYMLLLGGLEYKLYELNCEALRLRRKIELIQASINRQETVDIGKIDRTLTAEFAAYKRELDKRIEKVNAAMRHSEGEVMTEGEKKEFKRMYRAIVKALHPDLNPNVTDAQRQLLQNALKAYENGDIASMRLISEMVSEPELPEKSADGIAALVEEVGRLEGMIEVVQAQITKIKSEYPYILKPIVESEARTEACRLQLQKEIDEMTEVVAYYRHKLEGMVENL